MKHYIFYIIAATLLVIWALYADRTPDRIINVLPVVAVIIIFYTLITASPAAYRRRFRP
jgi:hypothetical protein